MDPSWGFIERCGLAKKRTQLVEPPRLDANPQVNTHCGAASIFLVGHDGGILEFPERPAQSVFVDSTSATARIAQ